MPDPHGNSVHLLHLRLHLPRVAQLPDQEEGGALHRTAGQVKWFWIHHFSQSSVLPRPSAPSWPSGLLARKTYSSLGREPSTRDSCVRSLEPPPPPPAHWAPPVRNVEAPPPPARWAPIPRTLEAPRPPARWAPPPRTVPPPPPPRFLPPSQTAQLHTIEAHNTQTYLERQNSPNHMSRISR